MRLKWRILVVPGILILTAIIATAQPAPFLITGTDYSTTVPVSNPDVTVTNLNTSEVFITITTTDSNYYQVETTLFNVSVGDTLHFHAGNGTGIELNHTITQDHINTGGFEQDLTIPTTFSRRICGDVNSDGAINMADVMTLWYDYADYPTPGAYTISNEWAADVNCDGAINMADVMTLWYDYADYPTPGAYEIECCGICGDVNDDGDINMGDVMTLWYDIADYPTPGAYTISNEWAADVNCDGTLDMIDVMTLWYDYADYPYPGEYEVNCCGG